MIKEGSLQGLSLIHILGEDSRPITEDTLNEHCPHWHCIEVKEYEKEVLQRAPVCTESNSLALK